MAERFVKIAQFRTADALRHRLRELGIDFPIDDDVLTADQGSPLAQPISIGPFTAGNRWCIHPMEGWDANLDGTPSEYTLRRWRHFGLSGAKLIWGGEAAAVQPEGRANPNQTLATPSNRDGLAALLGGLIAAHHNAFGKTDDLIVGLQLTHSGRFSRPNSKKLEPRVAYHHPLLDEKFGIDPSDGTVIITDDELQRLIDDYLVAAGIARDVGFQFVDIKACHGYLLHEMLSARTRPGAFGGDFEGRTRLLKTIVRRVREAYPELMVVVRLSAFDMPPFKTSRGVGEPMNYQEHLPYRFAFGNREEDPLQLDLREPLQLIGQLRSLGVAAINVSCGSPYYCPHIMRPAMYPPSDGYQTPEDPLVGVARQIQAARQFKEAYPSLPMVGTGYTYLQDFLPHVAQAVVRAGWIDMVGIGRLVLSYPEFPADVLAGRPLQRKRVCRTFSDCTTAPRNGMISGCFPLDPYYRDLPEAESLRQVKQAIRDL